MNYSEIIDASKAYADRQDFDVINNIDVFVLMAESRINRKLRVRKQAHKIRTQTFETKEMYALPDDYAGMRNIHVTPIGNMDKEIQLKYVPPGDMPNLTDSQREHNIYYTIVADQIQIRPAIDGVVHITYHRKVTPLSETNPVNWLSESNPDVYVSGIITEIEAFVKNYEVAKMWDEKMSRSITEMTDQDFDEIWAGAPMTMRVG